VIITKDCQNTDLTSLQVTALARTSSYSKLQTRPLVREGRYNINSNCLKENLKEIEKLVAGWTPDTKTDWPTNCRS
jgi:hypothetical protein